MARLRINWSTMQQVAPVAAATGEAQATESTRTSLRAEKPMLIYVTDDDASNKNTRKLEQIVFANEQVGIGAKFFETIRMTSGNALQDRILKDAGSKTPRLVFLSRDYKVHGVMEGRISAGKLLKTMKGLAKKEYVNSFDTMVRGYVKLLNNLDRLEGKKAQIADSRARLQAKPNKSKAKKIDREEKAYQKDVEEWSAEEKALLAFRRKGDAKPEA